ncbi:hemin uptake protein HemP [Loktanella sp. S4079]|uniref:hemin uptake protein HemP n=1 Tax=Loktanella sp. S4079 TaxID=579483 RepID=UPI0008DDACDC|nr:hemin uptake protein HemP [Loktanella sp. S4079]
MSVHPLPRAKAPEAKQLPTYAAEELTQGEDRALITLGDQTYILRITRAGKLILTK